MFFPLFSDPWIGTQDAMNRTEMTSKIPTLVALALLAVGCSRSGKIQHGQQDYQVVQEGSASGVTSTITGPGETTASATDTNADTTTNFTLSTNPRPLSHDTAGSNLADSLSSNPIYPAAPPTPRRTPPTGTPGMASAAPPVVIDTVGTTTPPTLKVTRQDPTDTSSTSTSATDAATTTTDQQQPPPPSTETRG